MSELAWRDGPQGRRELLNAEKNSPQIGLALKNGAICIDAGQDAHGYGYVLAVRTDMTGDSRVVDKWVTWEINPQGETFLGHYFDDLGYAYADYKERLGRSVA